MTVQLIAPTPYAQFQCYSGTRYTAGSDGIINANVTDVGDLLRGGCSGAIARHSKYTTPGIPLAASATYIVTSVTLSAGSLTIAHQPDVPRQLQALVTTGTGTLTAGGLTMTYTANDGTTQVDTFSFVGLTGANTLTTSKGVERLTSAVLAASAGGTAPGIEIGINAYLAVPLDPGAVDWVITKEMIISLSTTLQIPTDEAISTLTISTGLVSPTTVPDATHWLGFFYNYYMPA
jgi:hypothetical protein